LSNWQRLFDRRNRPAWAVLLVCLLLTLAAWYGLRMQAMKNARQQFELHSREVVGAIEDRLHQHEQILLGCAGLFDASESVDRKEWRAYTERLNLSQNYPGIQGVGFGQIIKPAELQSHIAAMRTEGFPGYTVRPPGERPLYTSTIYLEPFSGRNLAAFGYDMMSEATRAKAMRMAAESGKTAVSGKVKLVQETHGKEQAGFLMYLPIYRKHQPLATPEQRWKALQGFVYSPYRTEDLMAGILGNRIPKLRFVIFDGEGEADGARMYASAEDQTDRAHTAPPQISELRTIRVYGHTWTVRLHSSPSFEAEFHSPLNPVILALGGGISVLLFALVLFLIFRREYAEEIARQMTEEIRLNEENLRQSEARLNEGQRIAKLGSWDLNILTGKLAWSDEIFRLFEIDKNQFSPTYEGFLAAIHPEDRDAVNRAYADSLANHLPYEIIHRLLMSDGRIKWVQERCTSDFDAEDNPVRSRGTVQDITERRNAEEELARISNLNRAIVDGADHLIITTDTNGVVQSFNRSAEMHLGYQAEELVGKSTPAVFHDAGEIVRRAQELNAAGITVQPGFDVFAARARQIYGGDTHEWIYIRKDGSRFPVSLTITALRDSHGEINAFLGIATDISERRRAEEELRKLSRAIEQSPVSVVITNADGEIEYVNAKFSEVTGYAALEVIGRNPRIMQSGLTSAEVYQSMWRDILNGRQWRGKLQNRKKTGELFWEEIYISAIRDRDGKTTNFVAVKEDITERIKIERMKNEFISTVSHELRTPLTSIRGALALIVGGVVGELPAAAKPLVEIAHKNSERLILLVNDILDMEKIEAGKMEFDMQPVKLMPLLKQALEGNHAYAEQYKVSYEMESELASDLPDNSAGDLSGNLSGAMVRVDANRMMQVLANLLSNAAKYSPAGGKVRVAVERMGHRIRVAVKDNGPGIPDEFKGQIFQKFAQADSSDTRKKGGTGLGLSITKAMVEQMGGSIGFDSRPDVLTTFYVEFPIWQEAAVAPAAIDAAAGKKRVLICEDDRDIAALLRLMLEQAGLAADIAYSAGQAKQLLAQGSYAAMTLDLELPDQSGSALIRELRDARQTATLPIIVVSANAIEGRKELGSEAFSVVDWISKPINQEQLVAVLKHAVKRASGTRPRVLHVEDDPDIFQVVTAIAGEFAEIDNAASVAEARQRLEDNHYDLAILDLSLPDGSGMKLLPLLNGATPPVPVLVFSASEVGREDMHEIKSVLVKSRTDNAQLLATIKRLIRIE